MEHNYGKNLSFDATYDILGEIGKGGGGTVYKAFHKRLQKTVVLKRIHGNLTTINARNEADILKNLKSAYLPQVLDFIEHDSAVYTVMEYIEGSSFEQVLEQGQKFAQQDIVKWFRQLAKALVVLHTQNPPIIHGDIKPANIMLLPDGDICLIDFNVSSIFDGKYDSVTGYTPAYAAPEQIQYYKKALSAITTGGSTTSDESGEKTEIIRSHNAGQVGVVTADLWGQFSLECKTDKTEFLFRNESSIQTTELLPNSENDSRTELLPDSEKGDGTAFRSDEVAAFKTEALPHCFRIEATEIISQQPNRKGRTVARRKAFEGMQASIDTRTDIYCLGATMYHIITGERPVRKEDGIRHISEYRSDISDPLSHIVGKCLLNDPGERFQSAKELSDALNNLYQSTRTYQGLLHRQRTIRILLFVGTVGSALLAGLGMRMTDQERMIAYNTLVQQETAARQANDNVVLDAAFEKAVSLSQSSSGAYEEKGWYLFEKGEYENGLQFLMENAIPYVKDKKGLSNLYLLAGMDAYSIGKTKEGIEYLSKSIELNPDNAEAYQQYSIVIAEEKDATEAQQLLEKAVNAGLSDDGIAYARAEIAFTQEDFDTAKVYFNEAKDTTEDPYTKMCAYLKLIEINKLTGQSINDRMEILSEARSNVELQYRPMLDEQMAQAYIDRFESTGNEEDADEAVSILRKLANDGLATFQTYENMVRILQSEHKLEDECHILEEMVSIYGDDYRIYMYYAYVEVLKQEQLANEKRNYKKFLSYYDKAATLYAESKEPNGNDPMMQRLEEIYKQAENGNWL